MLYNADPYCDDLYAEVAKETGLPRERAKLLALICAYDVMFISKHLPEIPLDKLEGVRAKAQALVKKRAFFTDPPKRKRAH